MIIKSIRFQITIWYMLILAITLAIFSIILYRDFSTSLKKTLDDRLFSKAEGIATSIDTYWETEKLEAIRDGAPANIFTKINNINFVKIAKTWVEEKSEDPRFINNILQIYDAQGMLIISSRHIIAEKKLTPDILAGIKTRPYFYNLQTLSPDGSPIEMRMLAISLKENQKTAYIVQVGTLLNQVNTATDNLRQLLFIFLPITVILTGLVGAFLAKLTLRPVDSMIHAIRQLKASNLKARIPLPGTRDEIERLARTFNAMMEELDKVFSYQQQFIQDASHELRTPLTIIKGEFEVILKKDRTPEDYQEVMTSSLEEINKIIKIIENLLTLAKFDCQQIPVKFEPLALDQLIQEITQHLKVLADNQQLTLQTHYQNTPMIEGDRTLITRMLTNLIENAIKYTPGPGHIKVTLAQEENLAVILISDTGIGIPPDDIDHIFDRFYRVDKSRHFYGFGLGLSIVKSILSLHDGIITVNSELNKGTTFTLKLPCT